MGRLEDEAEENNHRMYLELCDWWRVKVLITNNTQLTNINNWLKAN